MNNKNMDQGSPDFSTIIPAKITLTKSEDPGNGNTTPVLANKHLWLLPAFATLLVIAIGVVFVLPHLVKQALLTTDTDTSHSASTSTTQTSKSTLPPEASPWQEAQEAKARNESKDLLEELLAQQEDLEQKNVQAWAADEYNSILKLATDGDAAYRERDFQKSTSLYGEALKGMTALLEKMEPMFEETLGQGNTALNNGSSTGANKAFELALLMKPDDERALAGIQRAKTLDQVLSLITEGNDLQQNNNLEPARKSYQQALAIDQFAEQAREQIKIVNEKILDRDFKQLMSTGYAHLQSNDLEKARDSFQKALKLKPNANEALSALAQSQTGITNTQIQAFLSTAAGLESQEKWNAAIAEYDKALALDANLAQAQEGKRYASSRATLDARLEQVISEPQRLNDKIIYEETRVLYQQAVASVPRPENRLSRQLGTLKVLLEQAIEPVAVAFTSDNLTEVVVYKVGTLGKFTEKSLTLMPGNYVAVGTREGYRDARVEFTVEAGKTLQPVMVSAAEKIASR